MSRIEELNRKLEEAYQEKHKLEEAVCRLEEECARAHETEKLYNQGYEMGMQLNAMKKGLVDAGLSEAEALQVMLTGIRCSGCF